MKKRGLWLRFLITRPENKIKNDQVTTGRLTGAAVRYFPGLSFFYLIGVLLVVNLPYLPQFRFEFILLVAAFSLLLAGQSQFLLARVSQPHFSVFLAVFLLAIAMASWQSRQHLADKLSPEMVGKTIIVTGWIASLPKIRPSTAYARQLLNPQSLDMRSLDKRSGRAQNGQDAHFLFRPDSGQNKLPETIQVNWYRSAPDIVAGQHWQLKIRLKAPRGKLNFSGFDYERWLFRHKIGALATVIGGSQQLDAIPDTLPLRLLSWRAELSSRLDQTGADNSAAAKALIKALAVADKSAIDPQTRDLFARTGTAHLLAISGLHIGLVAVAGLFIGRILALVLAWLLPDKYRASGQIIARQRLLLIPAMFLAIIYASLAGLSLPTQRAVIMLLVISVGVWSRRRMNPWQAWSVALLLVLLLDPLSVLDAGFWLSFLAVALLIFFLGGNSNDKRWLTMLRAQWVVILGLLPLTLMIFSRIPLASLLSNLLAIPLTGILLVPLILLAMLSTASFPQLAATLLSVAGWLLDRLLDYLSWLDTILPVFEMGKSLANWQLLFLFLAVFILLLPRALPRLFLLLLLVLPIIAPLGTLGRSELNLEMLDVGQGLAVLLSGRDEALLYDSGPGDGRNWDLATAVIKPAIEASRAALSRVIISHGDLDHAGGLNSLARLYPEANYYVNKLHSRYPSACTTAESIPALSGTDLEVNILHPNPQLPYQGNDSSCVLLLSFGQQKILLSGDITSTVEQRLIRQYPNLQASTILVPHHGSKTSSSIEFLTQLGPDIALISSGYGNRFHLPAAEILQRYQKLQIKTLDTAVCGAIRLKFQLNSDVIKLKTARGQRQAIWRQLQQGC